MTGGLPEAGSETIGRVIRALEAFRRLDPDMPIQYALSFLTIARNEGMSMGDLAQKLGIAQSSASRNIAALSRWHSFNKPGHDLVEAHEDPRERRRKLVRLTARGHALIAELDLILAGGGPITAAPAANPGPKRLPRPIPALAQPELAVPR